MAHGAHPSPFRLMDGLDRHQWDEVVRIACIACHEGEL